MHSFWTMARLVISAVLFISIVSPWIVPEVQADSLSDIPRTTLTQNGPILSFRYCYSCGYRKAFEEYSSLLSEKYPEVAISGANYDPPGMNLYLSKGILVTKLVLIFILMTSFDLWGYIGQPVPGWWQWCTQNKIYACMMIFFLGNTLEAQLISSGAFEIFFNDVPIWSKLQSGRIPAPQELFQIIENQLKFSQPMDVNPNFVK